MAESDLKDLSVEELTARLTKLKQEMLEMRIQATGGKLDKPHRLRLARREVARIMTWLSRHQQTKKQGS
ncbi:MAG: 50S ribosomal protein L29 [Candidatus Omnitrophica bacterium CG11_big_fil_rev_8_21_14_0_20_64_10]|nr:MAG: 50S ribosomal protein L29 [Candidatus Omnitrophica bacterium CG11_big_fil_rev_8_21_14_0_20_64_10]